MCPSLFPLPFLRQPLNSKSSSARVRLRYKLACAATTLANGAVTTLNQLYYPNSFPASRVCVTPASSAQLRILARLYRLCKRFVCSSRRASRTSSDSGRGGSSGGRAGDETIGFDVSVVPAHSILVSFISCVRDFPYSPSSMALANAIPPSGAGGEVAGVVPLSSSGPLPDSLSYFGVDPTVGAIPIVAERVALPSGLTRVPFVSLLPSALAVSYSSSNAALVLDPNARALPSVSSSPRFFGNESEYIKLLQRMLQLNMIAFTTTPMAVNGVFGVPKDGAEIRLIIDATPVNKLFIPCPYVALPNPSHLSRLYVPPGTQLWMAKCDLESFYHQLAMPEWLQPYFALPGLTAARLVAAGLIAAGSNTDPSSVVYPMCTTLPMGWSHSVFVGQSVHENVAYAFGKLDPNDNIVHLQSPEVNRPLHGLIVDDVGVLSNSEAGCTSTMEQLLRAYALARLQVKMSKLRLASRSPMQFLGMCIDGFDLSIHLPMDKTKRLACLTIDLLRTDLVSGPQLEKVVGLWTWQLMLARPGLAILHHSYAYINALDTREGLLWQTVRSELTSLLTILPLLRISMSDGWYPRVVTTDASEQGAGVVSTMLSHQLFELLWPLTASRHTLAAHMSSIGKLEQQSGVSRVESELVELRQPPSNSAFFQPSIILNGGEPLQLEQDRLDKARQYVAALSSSSLHWQTWISSSWRWDQHINALEVQSVALAIKRILSSPAGLGQRVLLLTDSAVTAYALIKGRSSAASLVTPTMKIAALVLGGGVRLEISWVPTHLNPADKPSRAAASGAITSSGIG